MISVLGIDIGGANLKAAHTDMVARSVPFALWKNPRGLTAALRELIGSMPPHDLLAVTMTGELCDCYATRREGVNAILDSAVEAAGRTPIRFWSTLGRFLTIDEARRDPLAAASANWLALATWAGRLASGTEAILIDMGTTTTDIVPLYQGKPIPMGRTDAQRLKTGELLYMGWRRTPVAAILGASAGLAAEVFATTLDVCLLLGMVDESEADCNSADARPATRPFAHARMARMLGEDGDTVSQQKTEELAWRVVETMKTLLAESIRQVSERFAGSAEPVQTYILAGSGEGVVHGLLGRSPMGPNVSMGKRLGPEVSAAACAYAVACLAAPLSAP